ncbi:MAG: glycosyltransferase family protein [Desulfobacterota bacterium]|nr:glycosyltransferase family protein [Thermodesulfobacteriota bacterium]
MNLVVVIQTRSGSTRFPGKVLLPLLGKPLFVRMVERVRQSTLSPRVVVATTWLPEDDVISRICEQEGLECFRGHPTDLLDRHYQVALELQADAVAKIPSDCPLIDPAVIDRVLNFYIGHEGSFDYVSNLHPPSYPDGNDVEVMSFNALETAWREAERDFEREHTTPFLWDQPERFRIGNIFWETELDYSATHRWTIDYEEDYLLIREIFETLYPKNPKFSLYEILELLDRQPQLRSLNRQYHGETWMRRHLGSLRTLSTGSSRETGKAPLNSSPLPWKGTERSP